MSNRKLYRSRYGQVFGVCQGIADWRDLPVNPIRLILIVATIFTGFFPMVIIYLLAAIFIPVNPYEAPRQEQETSTDRQQYRQDGDSRTNDELKEEYEKLKKKVEKMEEDMFDKERDWDQRFHEGNG